MQSGIQPMSINTLFQLNYLVKHEKNAIFRAEKLLMMPDLFAYFLTGECRSEFTEATTTQLIDQKTRGWNIRLIEALGLPKRIFAPLIQPGERYGMLKQELADEHRIEPVPVYACASHDTASAVLAVPTQEEKFAFLSCGTWTLFGTELKRPVVTEQALKMGLTNEGGCGGTTTLLKNIMVCGLSRRPAGGITPRGARATASPTLRAWRGERLRSRVSLTRPRRSSPFRTTCRRRSRSTAGAQISRFRRSRAR